MTHFEADCFGIPYPLKSGWLFIHGDAEITQYMREKLERKITAKLKKPRKKHNARPCYLQNSLDILKEKSGPVTIFKPLPTHKAPSQQKNIDPNSPEFLMSYAWRTLRMKALKLYGAVCACCGDNPANGAVMNVDHIKPRKHFPQLALDITNLQVLCSACNQGKCNWDDTDWREQQAKDENGGTGYELADVTKILRSF